LKDRAPHRLIAILLGYPLIATAVALDVVWALVYRQVLAVAAGLTMANTAMIVATGEVSRSGHYPGGDTAVALFFSFVTPTLTTLICRLGETLAEHFRIRRLPTYDLEYDWQGPSNATTLPAPNLVQPTLIDTEARQAA
jgi:hypothetical protein